jgi:hypothetical protein
MAKVDPEAATRGYTVSVSTGTSAAIASEETLSDEFARFDKLAGKFLRTPKSEVDAQQQKS